MQKIEISSKTIIFTVLFLLLLRVLWLTRELIYALFIAFIFMSALRPGVTFLSKKIPRSLAVFLVFIFSFAFISLLVGVVLPPLIIQIFTFFKNLPTLTIKTFPYLSPYFNTTAFSTYIPNIGQNLIQVVSNLFSNFLFVVSVFFFTFYLLLDERLLENLLEKIIDEKRSKKIFQTIEKVQDRMGSWVWGETLLMTIIGVMTYVGLSLLGVKYALPLAIIAGLLEALPMIGPIISGIPAFFVAASVSWFFGLSVIALFFVIQQVENNIVVPLVMRKAVGINPLLTLISLTVGGQLGGIIGAFLSIPVALLIEVVLSELLKAKQTS